MTAPVAAAAAGEGAAAGGAGASSGTVATRSTGTGAVASGARAPQTINGKVLPRKATGAGGSPPRNRPASKPRGGGRSAPIIASHKSTTTTNNNYGHTPRGSEKTWRRLLVAEFLVGTVILSLSPLTDKHKTEPTSTLMKRLSAMAALFLVLGLVSTGGRSAGKAAAAFGGLVCVALLVSERDLFAVLATAFNGRDVGAAGPDDTGEPGVGGQPGDGSGGSGSRSGSGGLVTV